MLQNSGPKRPCKLVLGTIGSLQYPRRIEPSPKHPLAKINDLVCSMSTMVPSGFGPYHGLRLEYAPPTKCIDTIPTPWVITSVLGLVRLLTSTAQKVSSVIMGKKMLRVRGFDLDCAATDLWGIFR